MIDIITLVLTYKGHRLPTVDVINQLMGMFPNHPYAKQKALGSLGGASNSGFITITNGYCERMR